MLVRSPIRQRNCKIIAIDLRKRQVLYADPKLIQQINLTRNLECFENTKMSFTLEEVKETTLDFSQGNMKVLQLHFVNFIWHLYHSFNTKLSDCQLDKSNLAAKSLASVILRLSLDMIGADETTFPHNVILADRQVANLQKVFANSSSKDIKFPKAQISKIIQSGGFLVRLLEPLMEVGLPFMKNVH